MHQENIEAVLSAETDPAALIAAGVALAKPQKNPDPDGRHFVVVPNGFNLIETLPVASTPARPKGLAKLRDAASFIRYFKDHSEGRSRVYATLEPARFLAVFDDFDDMNSEDMAAQADWREFRAVFEVPASREWNLWNAANRKHMGQLAFAEFLQDNLPDVVQPDGTTLLEMALNFEAAQTGTFIATQRLQNGNHNLQWKADNNAGGTVQLPEQVVLSIPVFENEAPSELHARLRYRVKEGVLSIWYELVRPHKVLEAAFRATWKRIEEEATATILLGTPE